jgi:hypothetical protein
MRSMDAEFRRLTTPKDKDAPVEVGADDVEGVSSLFSRMKARQDNHGDT